MLKSVLSVLALERRRVPDSTHRQALAHGRRVWREYYGTGLFDEWRSAPTLGGLIELLRLCPRQVVARAVGGVARRLQSNRIRLGSLRRVAPVSRQFGFDRGQPIDRYYIESFLAENAAAVSGCVLEIGDAAYSERFGAGRISHQDILNVVPGNPGTTIVADLADTPQIPSGRFDCIILTQTMQYIFDVQSATATLFRILKPGGTLLVTLPGISQVCRDQADRESDCWRFTASSARRLFEKYFGAERVQVRTYGNVLAAIAFLEGLAVQDLNLEELNHHDSDYQLTIAVAARKESS
jgi:SAM-dependent methyltransferase